MNYRLVFNQLGLLLVVLSALMLLMAFGFFVVEYVLDHGIDGTARSALLLSGGFGLLAGTTAWWLTRTKTAMIGRRDAMLLVALTWIVGAAFAAMPYYFWAQLSRTIADDQPFHSFTNCYFEAMSGLTTTGASILSDVEAVPRSLLLWRALTQWLGGLGIVVLFVAVLPALGSSARKMFRAEVSGVTKTGMRPQIRDTARILWYLYLGLTLAQIILLRLAGMDWFDSVCHTFATVATGGFSTRNTSIAAYDSPLIELVLIVFMVLGGVNFALYYQAIRGRFRTIIADPEFRLYLGMLAAGTIAIAMLIGGDSVQDVAGVEHSGSALQSIRHAAFTMSSVQTTTGFTTAEFDEWPVLARAILFLFAFVGGCAGSTSGGFKVIRLWILIKTLHAEIERAFRPSVMRVIRVGGTVIDAEVRLTTMAFLTGFLLVLVGCTTMLLAMEHNNGVDLTSALSATVACMCTMGPGLGAFGASENYGFLSAPSKWLLAFAMVVGRLEVFTILVLFSPRFWRGR